MALLTMRRRKPTPDELAARREAELEAADTAAWRAELAAGAARLDEQRRAADERAQQAADERRSAAGRARLDATVDDMLDGFGDLTLAAARATVTEDGRRRLKTFTGPTPVLGCDRDEVATSIVRRAPRVSLAWFQLYMRALGCAESSDALKARFRRATAHRNG